MKIKDRIADMALPLMGVLILSLMLVLIYPGLHDFEFDTDEGIELMKALLVTKGYRLYQEVWNDQPPVFTYALVTLFHTVGASVIGGRVMVFSFSLILMGAAWQILRILGGTRHALMGVGLIVLLPHYAILSISVMRGLPAIALAMVSLAALLTWSHRRSGGWLVVSAIALGLSVFTKAFTGFLAPVFVIGLAITGITHPAAQTWLNRLGAALGWGVIFFGSCLLFLLVFLGDDFSQVFLPHITAQNSMSYEGFWQKNTLINLWPTLFLAVIAIGLAIKRRHGQVFYLVAWVGIGLLLLTQHAPLWYHHELLATVPAAVLAGYAAGEVIKPWPKFFHRRNLLTPQTLVFATILGGVLAVATIQAPITIRLFNNRAYREDSAANYQRVAQMTAYAPRTQWVVTDRPMFAFRANLLVPPPLVVFSLKRVTTHELTEQDFIGIMREFQPEQLLMLRFDWPVINRIKELYYFQISDNLYLRNDLKE